MTRFCGVACTSLLLVAACAPANTPGTSPTPVETIRVAGVAGGGITVVTHPTANSGGGAVPFGIDASWAALRAAYDSLSLPVATFLPASHTLGTPMNMRVVRRLGKTALSKYINCGDTQGRPAADSYEVQLSVSTTLQPEGSGTTTVLTTVAAQARPITFSGEWTRCVSTGALETALTDLVRSQLTR